MDQQRKVIYERRLQIIDGDDLEEHTEDLLAGAAEKLVAEHCPTEFEEDWDLKALIDGLMQYYPTKFAVEDLAQAATTEDLVESIVEEALDYYEKHSESMPGGAETMRQIERDVYLQIMDARWRDHLTEMDNLKDGIHLRWTVQADPLNAWQQEGFSMFGQLMEVIDNDYLRYILHVEAVQAPAAEPDLDRAVYAAAEDPVVETAALAGALLAERGTQVPAQTRRPHARDQRERQWRGCAGQGADQAAQPPRPRRAGAHRQAAAREGRAQRPLLVRERQEVQVLPWRRLTGRAAEAPRDFTAELEALGERLAEAERYLGREKLEVRRAELEAEVAKPDLWDDPDHARSVTKELGRVSADLDQLDALRGALEDARALLELTEESAAEGDRDVALDAELVETVDALGTRLGALELQSLFSGEYDELDAVCEVHAGAGGTDAQDWTEMLLRMYQRWAERRGFTVEVDEATEGQEAGLLSATFIVHGRFAYGLLATERGVHRLVRMSPFDSQHRRQTSFASMDVTPFLEDVSSEVEIDEKDLRIDTYRSSGAGGQHVNKTDSAVRLTHLPTGIVVSCQNERSQHQNKAKAMQILGAKLAERARAERRAELDALSGERVDNAWGNQIRSYVMAPYQLVKDLRTGYETGNVDAVLDGDLDAFMEAELRRQREVGA